jgi:hypothetical protein
MPVSYAFRTPVLWSAMRRAAAEALSRARRLHIAPSACPSKHEHPTPNFAELSAFGDQRRAMQVFFDRATGATASASLCSHAMSEECVLPNSFGAGRFSFKRAPPKVDWLL